MVKFAEKGDRIVGGSDHGCVYVFKISDSDPIQVLYHERAESMIQTIAVSLFRNINIFCRFKPHLDHLFTRRRHHSQRVV
jgi:hypothetical protein